MARPSIGLMVRYQQIMEYREAEEEADVKVASHVTDRIMVACVALRSGDGTESSRFFRLISIDKCI